MKNLIPLIALAIFILSACSSDEDPIVSTQQSTINFTTNSSGPFKSGDILTFNIMLISDPTVGLSQFTLSRNQNTLINTTSFASSLSNITYDYEISNDDFFEAPVIIEMELTDGEGKVIERSFEIEVDVPYSYFLDDFSPRTYWNFVLNREVMTQDSADLLVEIPPFSNAVFTVLNDNVMYNVADSDELKYFNLNMTTNDILNAIDNGTELNIVSFQGLLPVVIDIRGTGEYAVINLSSQNGVDWGYRKVNETSGG